ncbi:hypothetical protein [Pseudohaliea rubra]|uniref:TonB C-terminal domain-containing protein n=1 Tax=Pseudohaliea rubra DSM 19751 TaxID=1265313 RepID=A0A095VRY7_9GAMM|nr:hypothetical protein [Pseudohaliea rubra]KGE03868.1 hypothetical protein HRUBRA_01524 [Pseudohaliea rubra DSM 19751]
MNFRRTSFAACAVFAAALAAAQPEPVQPGHDALDDEAAALEVVRSDTIRRYRDEISSLEQADGAYSPGLTEPLLELGLALQQAGQHAEAIAILKRGVHLARVNEGLYSEQQLVLIEAEIRSHIAIGDFQAADDRHRYLYRVQQRTLTDAGRSLALMRQARWQRRAYELGLDENGFERLLRMWSLYRLALSELAEDEGDASPNLLPPLYGMLRAQYLISGFDGSDPTGLSADPFEPRVDEGRFVAFRSQSYKQGGSVIRAIYDVRQAQPGAGPREHAEALVLLGDWRLWHDKYDDAAQAYTDALAELAALDDAEAAMGDLFGAPAVLPALEGIRPLPEPVPPEGANLLVEFTVDERGRVRDLDRVDEANDNEGIANRLLRKLRKTKFRPRFADGQPVPTTGIRWAYDTSDWQ